MAIPIPVHYPGRLLKVVPEVSQRIRADMRREVQQVAVGVEVSSVKPVADTAFCRAIALRGVRPEGA